MARAARCATRCSTRPPSGHPVPVAIPETSNVDDLWSLAVEAARSSGAVASGDRVVITAGTAVNIPGSTNVIKVDVA